MEREEELFYSERTSKNQKFDKRLIAHVVKLAEEGTPRRDLIKTYKMTGETLGMWLDKYSSILHKRKLHSTAEKRSIVRAIHGGMSIKEAVIVYNISSRSTIRNWIKAFSDENIEISISNPSEMSKKSTSQTESTEVKALKKALDEANLKIRALDTMIDIAEEQLKIDIRK
ncbi:helix-turn-helix domain-containing protein, partial [Pedobacter antarcticus]